MINLDPSKIYSYIIAIMRYAILVSPEAADNLKQMNAYDKAAVKELIDVHLRHEPMKESKSRIKKLHGISHPQYRLRVGKWRVFYDVFGSTVELLAIFSKQEALEWLKQQEQEETK